MKQFLSPLGITLNEHQLKLFDEYYQYLISENAKYNLTALKEKNDVYVKHFYDSVALSKAIDPTNKSLLDIGSGAGFPSVPLKIVFNTNITMVEAQKKKTIFLDNLLDKLALKGKVINARIEEIEPSYFNSFDIVTARAVAPLNILIELAIPFVKEGGIFIAMKGSSFEVELNEAKRGIILLGSEIEKTVEFNLPDGLGMRSLIIIKKNKHIKGYPRLYQHIIKKPLGSEKNE